MIVDNHYSRHVKIKTIKTNKRRILIETNGKLFILGVILFSLITWIFSFKINNDIKELIYINNEELTYDVI